ncbi:hypothetical protein K435DRAFT_865272 [Dendrothele bispora CBS 962.96]|uniref:MARVEL domain-containing protein n=1 Tax=Dendrothele bispora (strain CBS 962.96) TaxID=1314807 RepID=A0A4S8LJR5_DENBC|nr:hypothetical protein K435DRAFT_865272 [Dendrothele bispora CBS 962.96]
MGFWESLQKVKLQAQDGFDIPPLAETDQDSKEYPAVTGWRIALYSFVLAFAVFLDVLAPLDAALNSERRFMTIFASIVSVFSLLTWIWTSILLSRLNRPQSSSILTLASVHFYTFVSLTIVWLALGIMLATQTPYECDLESPSDGLASFWCGLAGTNISLSFIEFIFCGITTILLWKTTKGLSGNIGELDGVNSWYEMSKKKQAGATQV